MRKQQEEIPVIKCVRCGNIPDTYKTKNKYVIHCNECNTGIYDGDKQRVIFAWAILQIGISDVVRDSVTKSKKQNFVF